MFKRIKIQNKLKYFLSCMMKKKERKSFRTNLKTPYFFESNTF